MTETETEANCENVMTETEKETNCENVIKEDNPEVNEVIENNDVKETKPTSEPMQKFKKMRILVHAGAVFKEGGITEEIRLKRFGASEEEMKNWSALQRLGLTQSEMELGNSIRIANPCDVGSATITKVEKMTGCTEAEMKRAKALLTLGASEQEYGESRAKRLGQIGRKEEACYHSAHW